MLLLITVPQDCSFFYHTQRDFLSNRCALLPMLTFTAHGLLR